MTRLTREADARRDGLGGLCGLGEGETWTAGVDSVKHLWSFPMYVCVCVCVHLRVCVFICVFVQTPLYGTSGRQTVLTSNNLPSQCGLTL